MARISYLQKEQADPFIKEAFQKLEDQKLLILNLFKVVGHCPRIARNFMRLGDAILRKDDLSPKFRELAILRVGYLNRAVYEYTKHVPMGRNEGLSQVQIDSIPDWTNSNKFDENERAVLSYTDEVTLLVKATDATFNKIKGFLDEAGIVKLTATIGYYGMVCRILESLEVDLDAGEKSLLPGFNR